MNERPTGGFRFGPFLLLPDDRRLLADDQPVRLTPKAFDTLVLLVQSSGRLIGKDEFMRALWPDSYVEEVSLARNISDLRKALAERAGDVPFIETVPKHGYRFVAEVQRLAAPTAESSGPQAPTSGIPITASSGAPTDVVLVSPTDFQAAPQGEDPPGVPHWPARVRRLGLAVAVLGALGGLTAVFPRRSPSPLPQAAASVTSNPDARLAYLKGRYLWNRRNPQDLKSAVTLLEHAVRLDPSYALAYAGLADAYVILGGYSVANPGAMVSKARTAARTALDLDPSLAEAHTTLALIAVNYDWDWAEAERRYRRAIELNPTYAVARAWYGEFLAFMGRFDEGLAENARAQELDPLSIIISTDGGKILYLARRYDRAIEQLRKTLEMDPMYPMARIFLAAAYIQKGMHDTAIAVLDAPGPSTEDHAILMARGVSYAAAGKTNQARAILDRLTTLAPDTYMSPAYLAYIQIWAGLVDQAFRSLDRMCQDRVAGVIGLKLDPIFDPIRSDPRFNRLLRRVGLAG